MAPGLRRAGKEGTASSERATTDGKKESLAGSSSSGSRDSASKRTRNQTKPKADDGVQVSMSEKRFSSVSLPRRLLRTSMAPILSLKRVRITKASTGQFVVFLLRVAALEAIRRVSTARCPPVWWGLQGISVLQAPPFSWFLRWAPLRHLVEGTQSFSKPLVVLSLATAVQSAVEEIQNASKSDMRERVAAPQPDPQEDRTPESPERSEQMAAMDVLKSALEKARVELSERFADAELENFLIASNGNVQKFVEKVQKSVNWRQSYYFMTTDELKQWSHLVFWHDYDSKSRPTLIVRLGPAYATLKPDDRPRFCQAVVSQVEYGILNLLNEEDARITVIMDCKGTTAIGFPVHMMKSCAVLVQENYPTRLAELFAINLPSVLRFVSNTILQVVGHDTRKKVHLLGDVFLTPLSKHVGGTNRVPACLGGACHCPECMEERTANSTVHQVSVDRAAAVNGTLHEDGELDHEEHEEGQYQEDQLTNYQSYNAVLRVAIVCILMIWILITVAAAANDPDFLPT